jgi:hypothetical protein
MLYCELSTMHRDEILATMGKDPSSIKLFDPVSGNKVRLSETQRFVTLSACPTTRKEQLRLFFKTFIWTDSFLFIRPHHEPLPLWKRIIRRIIILSIMQEEYIQFIEIDDWTSFKKTAFTTLES